ncbi:MAG: Fe-S cluster assembly protein SufB, partial [Odoribacteraceae bacterium]|nr:Fe-S cluster assembly protein SufB [Odoribacteraceae bacterium]
MDKNQENILDEFTRGEYKHGFVSNVETETIGKGLNEEVVRLISRKKGEPGWLLEFRLAAYRRWLTMKMPAWARLEIPPINFQEIIYYAAPRVTGEGPRGEIDPELKSTFDRLGIPLNEREALSGVAVDAVMDSVSVRTTFKEELASRGIIFCSFSEAVREHADLVRQ